MFKVGDKIICIDSSIKHPDTPKYFKRWIKKDKEYIIRATRMSLEGDLSLLLEEVINPPVFFEALGGGTEPGFSAMRFNKLKKIVNEINQEMQGIV